MAAQDAEWVATARGLDELVSRLMRSETVAVDTEFFWERTYYPILGLVQLATVDGCWLVDTVALADIRAFGSVLAAPQITKLLHDAPQDLGILARATGALPRNVFDTRLAAGFAGYGSTGSLQALLRDALGVELTKTETRSDWLHRPLSASQIRYAADDVVHLIPLHDKLMACCANDTVRAWLGEELARMDDPSLYADRDPRLMYLRVKGGSRLAARHIAVLRELAAWREDEARQRDWPRGHVLPDAGLVAIALAAPADRAALAQVPGFPHKMPEAVVARLHAAVTAGLAVPDSECPQPAGFDLTSKRALKEPCDRLLVQIQAACEPLGIDPALVASRTDAENYVRSLALGTAAEHPLRQGWRSQLMADTES